MHFCGCVASQALPTAMNIPEIPDHLYEAGAELGVGILFSVLRQIAAFQSNVASDWLTCAQTPPTPFPTSPLAVAAFT